MLAPKPFAFCCVTLILSVAGSVTVAQPDVDRLNDARLAKIHAAYSPEIPASQTHRVDTLSQQRMAAIRQAYKSHDPVRITVASQ